MMMHSNRFSKFLSHQQSNRYVGNKNRQTPYNWRVKDTEKKNQHFLYEDSDGFTNIK